MKSLLFLSLLALNFSPASAASFQNLDFEQYDPTSGLVPGWTFENELVTNVDGSRILTRLPLDWGVREPINPTPPYATIYSSASLPFHSPSRPGQYVLGLIPRLDDAGFFPWFARQTAEIPPEAKSMSFELGGAQVRLKFDDAELALEYFFRTDTTFAGWDFADVSRFAGRTVTMEFTAPGAPEYLDAFRAPGAPTPYTLLDNIRFSSEPIPSIPEPAPLTLALFGAALALGVRAGYSKYLA